MSLMNQIRSELKRGASAANLQMQRRQELKKTKTERKTQALLQERKRLAEKKEYLDLQDQVRTEKSAIRQRQFSNLTRFIPKQKVRTKVKASLSKRTSMGKENTVGGNSDAWSIGRTKDNPWQSSSTKKKSPWDNPFK